jgi:hypothetical protein
MPIEVKRKPKEPPQSLVYRFTKAVRESGMLLSLRDKRFRTREKSRMLKRLAALRREEKKKQLAMEEKLGKPRD